jgi:hypothetical protein
LATSKLGRLMLEADVEHDHLLLRGHSGGSPNRTEA